jgi:hypothetical protein
MQIDEESLVGSQGLVDVDAVHCPVLTFGDPRKETRRMTDTLWWGSKRCFLKTKLVDGPHEKVLSLDAGVVREGSLVQDNLDAPAMKRKNQDQKRTLHDDESPEGSVNSRRQFVVGHQRMGRIGCLGRDTLLGYSR